MRSRMAGTVHAGVSHYITGVGDVSAASTSLYRYFAPSTPFSGPCFVLERERALEAAGQHDPHRALHVVLVAPAIPVLRVHVGVRVRRERLQAVEQHVLVLPVAEVGRRFAVRDD